MKKHITKNKIESDKSQRGDFIRREIFRLIKKDHPDFTQDDYISVEELNKYRKMYLRNLIKKEKGELNKLQKEVIEAIARHEFLSENIDVDYEQTLSFGQRLADKLAKFAGSWMFIIFFFMTLIVWMGINVWIFTKNPFDPYPFILLNLVLSCIAAIQAPIIIMSQNRLEEKDRKRGEHDYKVNLKAELEIRLLDEKMEYMITQQYKRMLEIQELQTDYLGEILKKIE